MIETQEIEIPRDDQLLPFCIYYYEDNHTGTIYCHIGAPELSVDKDGKNPRYKCFHESLIYNGWYSYGAFYSLDPQFRPIPNGMILLCARWRRGFPWQTFEISNARDPFNLQQDLFSECLYFYAYSSPAKNTVPLYFFKSGFFVNKTDVLLPTFDNNKDNLPQPGKHNGSIIDWEPASIPVVYVIGTKKTSTNCNSCLQDMNHTLFSNINNTCVPDPNGEYETIGKCIISTSNKPKRFNLLESVKEDSRGDIGIHNFFKSFPLYSISIIICLFVLSLLLTIITMS